MMEITATTQPRSARGSEWHIAGSEWHRGSEWHIAGSEWHRGSEWH